MRASARHATTPAKRLSRPHALLDETRRPPETPSAGALGTGATASQIADRILATLLNASGPVLLCMPGTLGPAWQSSVYETAREVAREYANRGAVSIVSIPYKNGVPDAIGRAIGIGTNSSGSVLALVIRGLHRYAPNRPILVVGESQGSWVAAHDLEDPELAAMVTRVALFAKPGVQGDPAPIGGATSGARLLGGSPGFIEFRHTDDIVPSLITRLSREVARGYQLAVRRWAATRDFEYTPHHYDMHGTEAAAYLLHGTAPVRPVHLSAEDA